MHLINQMSLGILIIILLGFLVLIKGLATGSILEKLKGGFLLWLVNIFNLLFLLVLNPVSAVILIYEKMDVIDPTFIVIDNATVLPVLEAAGLVIYLSGFLLMSWALLRLAKNYQLGGADPRANDKLVINGPYKLIRHPMYTAALCIALGLSLLIQSVLCFCLFCVYFLLIIMLIPKEEESLVNAYGDQYIQYRQSVKKLLPSIF